MPLGRWGLWGLAVVAAVGLLVVACGPRAGKPPTPIQTPPPPAPTPTLTPAPTPAPASAEDRAKVIKDYLARVFPPGPGRDEVFLSCTSCHGIHVTILSGQTKDEAGWQLTRFNHEVGLLAGQFGEREEEKAVWKYLVEHFGSDKPAPPPVPEELQIGWQNYL